MVHCSIPLAFLQLVSQFGFGLALSMDCGVCHELQSGFTVHFTIQDYIASCRKQLVRTCVCVCFVSFDVTYVNILINLHAYACVQFACISPHHTLQCPRNSASQQTIAHLTHKT